MPTTKRWHDKRIWTNGSFDILHRGHLELLNECHNLGNFVVVGIDSDRRIKEKKGDGRPFNNQEDRRYFLSQLRVVDYVVVFDTDEELASFVRDYNVDTMVVGSDWKGKPIIGSEHAGEVHYFDRIEGYSTTKILENK